MNSAAKYFNAPWSTLLIVISSLLAVVCIGITAFMVGYFHGLLRWWGFMPLIIVLLSALFTVRGYTISPNSLFVHRLLWKTRVPLAGLEQARVESNAMRGSIRLFGNGGLFSFSGSFANQQLGRYRAFVTDRDRTVVLRFRDQTVVISPASPEEFVRMLPVGTTSNEAVR